MGKIFSFNPGLKGSYIDPISGNAGVNTNGEFVRTEKGMAWKGNGVDSKVSMPSDITLSRQSAGFECWFKGWKNDANSELLVAGTGGSTRYFGRVSAELRLESNTNGDYWLRYGDSYSLLGTGWNHIVISADGGNVNTYLNGIQIGSTLTPTDDVTLNTIGVDSGDNLYYTGNIAYVEMRNTPYSPEERAQAYKEFLYAVPTGKEIYPVGNANEFKPKDLSSQVDTGLLAAFNSIKTGDTLVDVSGEGHNATLTGTSSSYQGLKLDGRNNKAVIGNIGNVKTVTMRIKLDSDTEKILEGAANDKLIHAASGTLTYPDFGAAYIDGIKTNSIPSGRWVTVTIISDTDVNLSSCTLGLNDATYGKFEIADLRFYSYMFTGYQITDYHTQWVKPVLIKDFTDDAVGNFPGGFTKGSGDYEVHEMTSQDDVIKEMDIGTKFMRSTSNGTILMPCKVNIGTVEFAFRKNGAGTTTSFYMFSDYHVPASANMWTISLDAGEVFRMGDMSTTHIEIPFVFQTATLYKVKLILRGDGSGELFVKGGTYGNEYTSVGEFTGGTLIDNPKYIIVNNDTGDDFADLKVYGGIQESPIEIASGYTDWFLPSKYELIAMHDNLHLFGVGGFIDDTYASSSELSSDFQWMYDFRQDIAQTPGKNSTADVRPCRTFTSSDIYSLRDTGPGGGLIFHITDLGGGSYQYLEAYPSDVGNAPFTDAAYIDLGTSTSIGTGQANTTLIINQAGHTTSAAKLCNDI